jgi:hypothetical protein
VFSLYDGVHSMRKGLKFDSAQAERQYHQVLARPALVCQEMWGCVALQYLTVSGKPLNRFEPKSNLLLAVATSGALNEHREISRFTVLHGSRAVVDWDLTRVCRDNSGSHIPAMGSRFFEMALSIDKAREQAAATPPLPHLNKFQFPKAWIFSAAPAALPIAGPDGVIRLVQRLKPKGFDAMAATEQAKAARAALLNVSVEADAGWYTPTTAISSELTDMDSRLFYDMEQFKGVTIRNPLEQYLNIPNPYGSVWKSLEPLVEAEKVEEFVQAARQSLGALSPLFDEADIIDCVVDNDGRLQNKPLQVSGRRVPTIQEMEPLLKQELGQVFNQLDAKQLAQLVAFPATPVVATGIGKPMFFFKGFGSNTDALRRVGIEYPDLPNCFLPREGQ